MGFAFELGVRRTGTLQRLHAALIVFAAAGFALAGGLAPAPWPLAWWAAAVPACLAARRFGARGLAWGRLRVDAAGGGRWMHDGASAPAESEPVRIERWCATEGLVWLRFREAGGAGPRRDALIARDACDAAQWRGLRAWLVWLGRGPA